MNTTLIIMLEILQYDFMWRAFAAGLMIAIIAPLIGIFLVVRRFSLIADTLSHVSLVGIAIGLLFNINPVFTALATTLIASIGIEKIRKSKMIFEESILAVFLSGSLATALIIISFGHGFTVNLFSYLFGSITTVTQQDLFIIFGFGVLTITAVWLFYKELFLTAFDEELAQVQGIPITFLNTLLIALAAVAISLAMRIVGILLTSALMIIPVLTAMQWTKSFKSSLFLSIFFSIVSVLIGLFASYYLNLSAGGTIVEVTLLFFGGSWFTKKVSSF
ncbi:MAG: metal ABC transporter permease [Patescibacteria group bacterium]